MAEKDQRGTRPALTVASSSRELPCTWAARPFWASRCNKMEQMFSGESFSVEHCDVFQEGFLSWTYLSFLAEISPGEEFLVLVGHMEAGRRVREPGGGGGWIPWCGHFWAVKGPHKVFAVGEIRACVCTLAEITWRRVRTGMEGSPRFIWRGGPTEAGRSLQEEKVGESLELTISGIGVWVKRHCVSEKPASVQCQEIASRWHCSTSCFQFLAGLCFEVFCYFLFCRFFLPCKWRILCLSPVLPPCTHLASFQLLSEYFFFLSPLN